MPHRSIGRRFLAKAERISCGWEPLQQLLDDPSAGDILRAHYELNALSDFAPVEINWPEKLSLEKTGRYRVLVCRVDQTLAGFIACFISPHINHSGTLFAHGDVHFLSPAFRGNGRVGWRMWRSCHIALRGLGVKVATAECVPEFLPFYIALGAEPVATQFAWRL